MTLETRQASVSCDPLAVYVFQTDAPLWPRKYCPELAARPMEGRLPPERVIAKLFCLRRRLTLCQQMQAWAPVTQCLLATKLVPSTILTLIHCYNPAVELEKGGFQESHEERIQV